MSEHFRAYTPKGELVQWVDEARYQLIDPVTREPKSELLPLPAAIEAGRKWTTEDCMLSIERQDVRCVIVKVECIWPYAIVGTER